MQSRQVETFCFYDLRTTIITMRWSYETHQKNVPLEDTNVELSMEFKEFVTYFSYVPRNSIKTLPHDFFSGSSPPLTPSCPSLSSTSSPNQKTHAITRLNILQHDIDGIINKLQLRHHLLQHGIHIAIIQEIKLKNKHKTLKFPGYTTFQNDRSASEGGGLITIIDKHHTNSPTHVPYNINPSSPDIPQASPNIALQSTWHTCHALCSNHLPFHITTNTLYLRKPKRNFINYKRAAWPASTATIEQHLQTFNFVVYININLAVLHFNTIITDANKTHIPTHFKTLIPVFQ